MSCEKRLENLVDVKDHEVSFDKITNEIDEILSRQKVATDILKELICHYEAKKNVEDGVSYMTSILYAVLIGLATIMANLDEEIAKEMVLYLLLVICLLLLVVKIEKDRRYRIQFVLNYLKLKYEELSSKSQISNGDQSKECREYIVVVKEKDK